jgi:hypothetical protein
MSRNPLYTTYARFDVWLKRVAILHHIRLNVSRNASIILNEMSIWPLYAEQDQINDVITAIVDMSVSTRDGNWRRDADRLRRASQKSGRMTVIATGHRLDSASIQE